MWEVKIGKECPATLVSKAYLVDTLSLQGKYKEAEEVHRDALSAQEKKLGREHPGTLASLQGLASICHFQGRFREAEFLYQQVLEKC